MNDNKIVKKSIFQQRKVRKLFDFKIKEVREFSFNCFRDYIKYVGEVESKNEIISESNIFICNLEIPLLKEGDKFFIEEINETVIIKDVVRTSTDGVCYYLEDKVIEDDISNKSLSRANQLQEELIKNNKLAEECDKLNNKLDTLIKFEKEVKNSFWYRFVEKDIKNQKKKNVEQQFKKF